MIFFFTSEQPKRSNLWLCPNICDALHYLLDITSVVFGSKMYKHNGGFPMGTYRAPPVAGLVLFCYEIGFMMSIN